MKPFEERLARLLAGETPPQEREAEIAALRERAAELDEPALQDLLELAARDDLAPEPPDGYWDDFQSRLEARLPARSRRGWVRPWAAAAAVVLAATATWTLVRERGGVEAPLIAEAAPEPSPAEPLPLPVVEEIEGFGLPALDAEPVEGRGIFPEVEDLDARQREELLRWLQEQNASLRGTT